MLVKNFSLEKNFKVSWNRLELFLVRQHPQRVLFNRVSQVIRRITSTAIADDLTEQKPLFSKETIHEYTFPK